MEMGLAHPMEMGLVRLKAIPKELSLVYLLAHQMAMQMVLMMEIG